jgi:hypothetical protein
MFRNLIILGRWDRETCLTTLCITKYVYHRCYLTINTEDWWNIMTREKNVLWENPIAAQICLATTPKRLAWAWIRPSGVKGKQLAAWINAECTMVTIFTTSFNSKTSECLCMRCLCVFHFMPKQGKNFPIQTWLRPVTTCVCKPEAANIVRAPDDEWYAARNMLSCQLTVE